MEEETNEKKISASSLVAAHVHEIRAIIIHCTTRVSAFEAQLMSRFPQGRTPFSFNVFPTCCTALEVGIREQKRNIRARYSSSKGDAFSTEICIGSFGG